MLSGPRQLKSTFNNFILGHNIFKTSCPGRDFAILGEIPKRRPGSSRVFIKKYFQLQYTVSMPEKNLNLLDQGPHGIVG